MRSWVRYKDYKELLKRRLGSRVRPEFKNRVEHKDYRRIDEEKGRQQGQTLV